MRYFNRIIALSWLLYILIVVMSMKEVTHDALVEPVTFGTKLKVILYFFLSTALGYLACKERWEQR